MTRPVHRRRPLRPDYQPLELRQLLATTLYVDFGFGFSDGLLITDNLSTLLNGPEIFGQFYNAGSLADGLAVADRDVNQDGEVNFVDALELADETMVRLNEIFLPFDIVIEQRTATSFADISNLLVGSINPNTYVYVGAVDPTDDPDFGIGVQDPNNSSLNLAFVWGEDAAALPSFLTRSSLHDHANFLARSIAKQAGHTFGILSTEANLQENRHDVMAERGTNNQGNLLDDWRMLRTPAFFSNFDLRRPYVNGAIGSLYNPFDSMRDTFGLNDDAPAYFNGRGTDDSFEITYVSQDLVDVLYLDRFNNPTQYSNVDVTNGLYVSTGVWHAGFGNRVTIDPMISVPITVVADNVEIESGPVEVRIDAYANGTINQNIQLSSVHGVTTHGENDQFFVAGSIRQINAGAGNDVVEVGPLGNVYELYLEGGDDILRMENDDYMFRYGGDGFDVVDFRTSAVAPKIRFTRTFNGTFLGRTHQPDVAGGGFDIAGDQEFEQYYASVTAGGTIETDHGDAPWELVIDRQRTALQDDSGSAFAEMFGFDKFTSETLFSDNALVKATQRPLEFTSFDEVYISSTTNHVGDIEEISAAIAINGIQTNDPTQRTTVVLNDRGSNQGRDFVFADGEMSWNGQGKLKFGDGESRLRLFGSRGDDSLLIRDSQNVQILFWADSGDDTLRLGSYFDEDTGDLNQIQRPLLFWGGQGDNVVAVNDRMSSKPSRYAFGQTSFEKGDNSEFGRLDFVQVSQFRIKSTNFNDYFQITAVPATQINIDSGNSNPLGDRLKLEKEPIGVYPKEEQGSGVAWYGSTTNSIVYISTEYVTQQKIIASGSASGGPSIVKTYDANSLQPIRRFSPYGSFNGGVQVATGDITGDGIDDIITAPGPGMRPLVKVFDGNTGHFVTSILAFSQQFQYGVDVSVANVLGDSGLEMIVSKLDGQPRVRVFGFDNVQNRYVLQRDLIAFGNRTVGVNVDVADLNFDGYGEVVASKRRGPSKVAVFDVQGPNPIRTNLFTLGNGFDGGVNITFSSFIGNAKPDLIFTSMNDATPSDEFSGPIYLLSGQRMPQQSDMFSPLPDDGRDLFGTDRFANIVGKDLDGDGFNEVFFAGVGGDSPNNKVLKVGYEKDFQILDLIFETEDFLQSGFNLG